MWVGDTAVAAADLASMSSFFTIAFASFVEAQHDFSQSFSDWLKVRPSLALSLASCLRSPRRRQERRFTSMSIMAYSLLCPFSENHSQVLFLRKSYGTRLSIFSPVNDLSSLSKSGLRRSLVRGQTNDVAISGAQILGDEYSDHVLKVRPFSDDHVAVPHTES